MKVLARPLLILLLMSVAVAAPHARADAREAGRAVIQNLIDDFVAILADKNIDRRARDARYKRIVKLYFDLPTIAAWVLGKAWDVATPLQQQEFLQLFEVYSASFYGGQLAIYQSDKFKITTAEDDGKGVVVTSEIIDAEGDETEIKWRLRQVGGRWLIRDVLVEGVSLSLTQREAFEAAFRDRGRSVEGLLVVLRGKVADFVRQ